MEIDLQMDIINVVSLEVLKERNATQKLLSETIKTKVTDVFETNISFSFRVFDSEGKTTLSFWQYLKPAKYEDTLIIPIHLPHN